MKKNLILLMLAAVGFASCNGGFKQGPAGMLYDITVDKSGPTIKPGDFIAFNIIVKNDKDSILYNSYDGGFHIKQQAQAPQQKNDVFACLSKLSEGDSAIFKINIDSIFKKGQRPPQIKGKYLEYLIKVDKVIPKGNLSDQVFAGRVNSFAQADAEVAKKAEVARVKKYIDDHKLKVTTTASGLNYVITKPGSGATPAVGDSVEVYYVGRFITNKIFETNVADSARKNKMFNPMNPYRAIKVPVGMHGVIAGWDEGLQLLNKGAEATFIIPSKLAYGEQGFQSIAPFTPLVFNVQVVSITKPNPNAPKPAAPNLIPPQPNQPVKK